jgi:arylsulfatase
VPRRKWELYNIEEAFSQANDLANKHPEKVKHLQAIFDQEAKKYGVYPLDDRFAERVSNPHRPSVTRDRTTFTYLAGTTRLPEGSAPPICKRSHRITADLVLPDANVRGVIIAEGGSAGGYSLYIKDGRLTYEYNFFGKDRYTITSNRPLPTGKVQLAFEYAQQQGGDLAAGGTGRLFINGQAAGEGRIDKLVPAHFSGTETLDIGMDLGSVVSQAYHQEAPFAFSGQIERVMVELDPRTIGRAFR